MTDHPCRPLTPRQMEVARLVAAGLSRREIARTLAISPFAVKRHVENIAAKLPGESTVRSRIVSHLLRREAA